MPSTQFLSQVLAFFLAVFFFVLVYIGISHFHQRYRIQRLIKSYTAANKARLAGRFAEAHRHVQEAMDRSAQMPRHWKIRAVTFVELASLLGAEGKFAEAEKLLQKDLVLREKFDGPRAPETAIATSIEEPS